MKNNLLSLLDMSKDRKRILKRFEKIVSFLGYPWRYAQSPKGRMRATHDCCAKMHFCTATIVYIFYGVASVFCKSLMAVLNVLFTKYSASNRFLLVFWQGRYKMESKQNAQPQFSFGSTASRPDPKMHFGIILKKNFSNF